MLPECLVCGSVGRKKTSETERADSVCVLFVTDNERLTDTSLALRESTLAFELHLFLHHQCRGVMEVLNSVAMFPAIIHP